MNCNAGSLAPATHRSLRTGWILAKAGDRAAGEPQLALETSGASTKCSGRHHDVRGEERHGLETDTDSRCCA